MCLCLCVFVRAWGSSGDAFKAATAAASSVAGRNKLHKTKKPVIVQNMNKPAHYVCLQYACVCPSVFLHLLLQICFPVSGRASIEREGETHREQERRIAAGTVIQSSSNPAGPIQWFPILPTDTR